MVATRRQSKASQQHRSMRLPEVLLDAVLAFSDLRTRSLAVTTSHEFCESYARLAKTLEPRLVRERFPLLATCVDGRAKASVPAPRELCQMFSQMFSGHDSAPPPESTVGLEAYTLCLELELVKGRTRETLFLGSGTLSPNPNNSRETRFQFVVPGGTDDEERYSSDDERYGCTPPAEAGLGRAEYMMYEHGYDLEAKVVATRMHGNRLQFAKLFHGHFGMVEDGLGSIYQNIPSNNDKAATAWAEPSLPSKPQLNLYWMPGFQTATESPLNAYFAWGKNGEFHDEGDFNSDMSEADARMTLEHYVDWK